MLSSRACSVALLATALSASLADSARLRLDAGPAIAPLHADVAWQPVEGRLVAAEHPLTPSLGPEALELTIPNSGLLRVEALRVGPFGRGHEPVLAPAQATPRVAELLGSWQGVEERFTLRNDGVK